MNKIQQAYKALSGNFPNQLKSFYWKNQRITRQDFIKLGERK